VSDEYIRGVRDGTRKACEYFMAAIEAALAIGSPEKVPQALLDELRRMVNDTTR